MRFSLYQTFGEDKGEFKLFVQTQKGTVKGYQFFSSIKEISNVPGLTRLFGAETAVDKDYLLYPIDYTNASVGEFNLLEENEKFTRLDFGSEGKLQGEWLLRRLSSGETLLWKPFPIVGVMPTKNVEVSLEQGEIIEPVEQQFSIFDLSFEEDNSFRGILAAEGIWTGGDRHTTLFSDKIIIALTTQMQAEIDTQLVDFDHSFKNEGRLTKVELREERGINYIWVEGVAERAIPHGAGLSITLKSTLKWNSKLNVYVLLSATPIGLGIMTGSKPACTICMIR